jgi:hypothetical protein
MTRARHTENGSVLVYIFIAIALLGALTLAVANSTSGYVDTGESDRLRAQSILTLTQTMAMGVIRIHDRGLTVTARSMASPTMAVYGDSTANIQIFHPSGGGASYQPGGNTVLYAQTYPDPHAWLSGGNYFLRNAISVPGIGTAAGEVVVFVWGLQQRICQNLNSILHNDPAIPVIDQTSSNFGAEGIPAITDSSNTINNHRMYCVRTATGDGFETHLFYHVVIVR